jgi:DNA polymerase-3 subunit epsilon
LTAFSEAIWFPARIPFGKFKGRLFREALHDSALHDWLGWLAASTNSRSAQMGGWYLAQLNTLEFGNAILADVGRGAGSTETTVVVFAHPDICHLKSLIEAARTRLADLETTYTRERQAVSTTQAKLFDLLRPLFQKRDLLKLSLSYRRKFLETLLYSGEEDAAAIDEELEQAQAQTDAEYEHAATASLGCRALNEMEAEELKKTFRKLVKLFHPDRHMDDEDKHDSYQKLTAEINRLRDSGDIAGLREIADDPKGFIARQGWGSVDLEDSEQLDTLTHLYESLQGQIIELLGALDTLQHSAEYELHQLASEQPDLLARVAKQQSLALEEESKVLEAELKQIEKELEALQA